MDIRREFKEFAYYLRAKALLRIPNVSGLAGLLVGAWVMSTFSVSPVRAFLARGRILRGSRYYVDADTYRVLVVVLPLLAAAATAYAVQRFLSRRRDEWLAHDIKVVARRPALQEEVQRREAILDEALRLGMLTAQEHVTKRAALYAFYARDGGSHVGRLIAHKLT